jgi:hypothetical protein
LVRRIVVANGAVVSTSTQTDFGSGGDALMTSTLCEIVLLTWLL